MNYIILDLEFNQAFPFKNGKKYDPNPECPFEIIQIGAVKLDKNMKQIGTYDSYIKPQIYPRLHPFVGKITKIAEETLQNQPKFPQVYEEFLAFIGEGNAVLCTWGSDDIKSLFRNILFYKQDSNAITHKHLNIQNLASKHLNYEAGNAIGLKNAAMLLNIPLSLDFHDALSDAIYTARIFEIVRPEQLDLMTFIPSTMLVKKEKQPRLSTRALTKHIEDVLQKKLTPEEKKLVKMAYVLGQSHAFDVTFPSIGKKKKEALTGNEHKKTPPKSTVD